MHVFVITRMYPEMLLALEKVILLLRVVQTCSAILIIRALAIGAHGPIAPSLSTRLPEGLDFGRRNIIDPNG